MPSKRRNEPNSKAMSYGNIFSIVVLVTLVGGALIWVGGHPADAAAIFSLDCLIVLSAIAHKLEI